MIQLEPALESLTEWQVEFVIVGGVAVTAHGSAYLTQDLDFCYARTNKNLEKIVAALSKFRPRLRGFPENLPFVFDVSTLRSGTNFTFATEIGDIDLLGEVSGVGTFENVKANSEYKEIFGFKVRVLSLDALINAKRAAGRTKDLLVLPELEALREALSDDEEE
jgi:predicted nucleotidyltransferase